MDKAPFFADCHCYAGDYSGIGVPVFKLCPFCGGILLSPLSVDYHGKIEQSRNLMLWNGSVDDDIF
jgi:hypothetical protein